MGNIISCKYLFYLSALDECLFQCLDENGEGTILTDKQLKKQGVISTAMDAIHTAEERWFFYHDYLKGYIEEHHGKYPTAREAYKGINVGEWLSSQIDAWREENLNPSRKEALTNLPHWEERIAKEPGSHAEKREAGAGGKGFTYAAHRLINATCGDKVRTYMVADQIENYQDAFANMVQAGANQPKLAGKPISAMDNSFTSAFGFLFFNLGTVFISSEFIPLKGGLERATCNDCCNCDGSICAYNNEEAPGCIVGEESCDGFFSDAVFAVMLKGRKTPVDFILEFNGAETPQGKQIVFEALRDSCPYLKGTTADDLTLIRTKDGWDSDL